MGFFKKLKERLFTLKVDPIENIKEKKVEPKKDVQPLLNETKEQSTKKQNKKDVKVIAKEKKLQAKIEKQRIKQLKKEKKLNKYVAGLEKSGSSLSRKIKELQSRHVKLDEDFFDELEDELIMSDISMKLVMNIIAEIKKEVKIEGIEDPKLINEIIADKLFTVYANQSIVDTTLDIQDDRLNVLMFVGVNGSGKTTTIAKVAKMLIDEGKEVIVAAGDTFRAGAVEQLGVWAERVGAQIIKPKVNGADPASVVFDALEKAKEVKADVLIIDTAGRLQNKVNLMNELEKMSKIVQREVPDAPHESILVLDATTGQNGVSQAKHFKDVTPLTGIILTKMDGTSKGGIVLTIKDELELPVKMIGLGEKLDDLQEFDLDAFIYGLTRGLDNNEE